MKIVILAGGTGTRLWPISRRSRPKQFSSLLGDKTMFEVTVDRFRNSFDLDDVYVSCNASQKEAAKALVPEIADENYILEPEKRDTAPAMGFVAAKLSLEFPDEPIAFVPADHFIANTERFISILRYSDKLIRDTGKMIDIAIQPNFPSTVLGYTQIGQKISDDDGIEVFSFKGHTEKPDFETAQKYLQDGSYLWHANYYMWTPEKILEAFHNHSPEHYAALQEIIVGLKEHDEAKVAQAYGQMEKISFDYAVTEKIHPEQVLIIRGDFGWSDIGAFDVLYDAQKSTIDEQNNVILAQWEGTETTSSYIYGPKDKLIATIGIDDLVIVDTTDVLLICRKGKAQSVKTIVEQLKEKGLEKFL